MKARGLRDLRKEQEVELAIFQYELYQRCVDDMFRGAAAAIIAVMEKRKLSKQYIRKWYDDFIMVLETPNIFDTELTTTNLMAQFKEKYDIDFDRIHVNCESLDAYKKRCKIGR